MVHLSKLIMPLLLLTLGGCSKGGDDGGGGSGGKGTITGIVKDVNGNPLRNAVITIDNSLSSGQNKTAYTGPDGKYVMSIPVGSFIAYGEYAATFNGNTYSYELEADNNDPFNREDAVVRNFTWKTKGAKRPPLTDGYFGGTVHIDSEIGSEIIDVENIVFTLTPLQTIDGSSEVLTKRLIEDTYRLFDVPIGRYRISARYNGAIVKLRIKNAGSYQETLEFVMVPKIEGVGGVWCWNCISLEFNEK